MNCRRAASVSPIQQSAKWLQQFVVDDAVCAEIELLEEHAVQLAPYYVRGLPIQLLRVVEQIKRGAEDGGPGLEFWPVCQLGSHL